MHEVKFEEAQERELRVVKKSMANIICENGQLRNYLIITSLFFIWLQPLFTIFIMGLVIYSHKYNKPMGKQVIEDIIPNKEGKKYMLSVGREVKAHLGDGAKSSVNSNLTGKDLLLNAEKVKRMGGVLGTTGSGKTVWIKGVLEQQLLLGGGAFLIDGKGTIDELKRIIALVMKANRLRDFYFINFANPENSNSVDIFGAGSADDIIEVLSDLVPSTDPKWKGVSINYMKNVLKILVYRRDVYNERFNFNKIRVLSSLLVLFQECAKIFQDGHFDDDTVIHKKDRLNIEDVIKYITDSCSIGYQEVYEALLSKDKNSIAKYTETINKICQENEVQGVYDISVAITDWNSIIATLCNVYGEIFNAEYPDYNLIEAVNNNKICWVILPTMKSDETAKKMGKLLLGIMRRACEMKSTLYEPDIPHLFMLDEVGSYASAGLGRLMSKGRSLGFSIWLFFQSLSQLDAVDDGKSLEQKEIMEMSNNLILLKTEDNEVAKKIIEKIPKTVYLTKEVRKKKGEKDSISYSEAERDQLIPNDLSAQSLGEMHYFTGGKVYKAIGAVPSSFSLTYKGKKLINEFSFPTLQLMPKENIIEQYSALKSDDHKLFNDKIYNVDIIAIEKELGII